MKVTDLDGREIDLLYVSTEVFRVNGSPCYFVYGHYIDGEIKRFSMLYVSFDVEKTLDYVESLKDKLYSGIEFPEECVAAG